MLFAPVKRILSQSWLLLAGLILLGCAVSGTPAGRGLTIRTAHRVSGGLIEKNPHIEESIVYLQDGRRRTEEKSKYRKPYTVLIESCENDARKAFRLDLDSHTYAPVVLNQKLTAEQIQTFKDSVPKTEIPTRPTMLHEITTRDTGERRESFGYTARHVITTSKITPIDNAQVASQESITDGWYIDLDAHIPCDVNRPEPREGTTYQVAQLVAGTSAPGQAAFTIPTPASASAPNLVQTTYVGKPETGFPIWVKTTRTENRAVQGIQSPQVYVETDEVEELSTKALNPRLFEVPKNFRSAPIR